MDQTNNNIKKLSPGIILAALELAAIAGPLSLNKVSPIAPGLKNYFGIGESQIGTLVSVFSLAGIVLALPGGMMIRKFGHWKCILTALFTLFAGSVFGTFSGTFVLLLASRVIEGIGMTLIAVAGPSIIGEIVSSKRRGVAMGFFSAYMGIGQVVILNLAPRILKFGGWQSVWWFTNIYIAIVTFIWIVLMLRLNAFSKSPVSQSAAGNYAGYSISTFLKNRNLWLLSITVCLYMASYVSIQTFLPSYFTSDRGIDLASASSLVSICCLTGTLFSLFAGLISDKLGSRRILGGLSLAISGVLFYMIPFVHTSFLLPYLIVLGIIPPILFVCVYAAASEITENASENGIVMGLISMGQNIGLTAGPVLFGISVQGLGWTNAFILCAPVAVIGSAFLLAARKIK